MEYFFVYILRCRDKSYYVGHTDNLEKRLAEHNAGLSHYTSTRLPVTLVYSETFQTREEAFNVEWQIKGWGRKKREALMQKNFSLLTALSKNRSGTSAA